MSTDDLASMTVEQLTHDIEVAITWMPTASGRRHTRAVLNELVRRLTEMERVLALYEYVPGPSHEALDPEDPADDECPECGAFRSVGWHMPTCDIARLLGRPTEAP